MEKTIRECHARRTIRELSGSAAPPLEYQICTHTGQHCWERDLVDLAACPEYRKATLAEPCNQCDMLDCYETIDGTEAICAGCGEVY